MALGTGLYAVCGRAVGTLRRGIRPCQRHAARRRGYGVKDTDASNGVCGLLRQIGKYAIILSFSKKQRLLLIG